MGAFHERAGLGQRKERVFLELSIKVIKSKPCYRISSFTYISNEREISLGADPVTYSNPSKSRKLAVYLGS
jgi:hypothetical protein